MVKSLPDALVVSFSRRTDHQPRENFVLFTKAKSTIYWTYMGSYKSIFL
jgi:mitochondrial fission protein ELM1